MTKKILVTGGAGYIGSHITLALLEAGHDVVVLDNLCNSSQESLYRVAEICGKEPLFIEGDIRDHTLLDALFAKHPIDAVLHFAGLKAVGESVRKPLDYYENNVAAAWRYVRRWSGLGCFGSYLAPLPLYMASRRGCQSARISRPVLRPIPMAARS